MKSSIILALAILISAFSTFGVLPPTECAPLGEHLMEVNKEWAHMWPEMSESHEIVCFENESRRIRKHLELVISRIREGASPAKAHLLDELSDYAENAVFPVNHVLPYRNPVFIDHHGTACAVGHLIIQSGNRRLAEHIDSEMELAYVKDMNMPAILDWASEFGFTEDELAWIQPGYPPSTFWTAPGGGLSGKVTAMTTTASGLLVVAGDFDISGHPNVSQVATWDGSSYTALGSGLLGPVFDLIEFNGQIHAAGAFYILNSFHDIAVWDGTYWNYGNAQYGMAPANFDLHIHDNELHAAGLSSGFAGVSHMVMRYSAGTWTNVGSDLNDTIRSLETHDGKLIVGGDFTGALTTTASIAHVAMLDASGNWVEAYGGLNAPVNELLDIYGSLYAGGPIGDINNPLFGLAARFPNNTSWTPQFDYMNLSILPFNGEREIRALQMVGTQMFAGGSFDFQPLIGTMGQNIMWIDYNNGWIEPEAIMDGPVHCMAEGANTSLYIGGEFTTMNMQSVPNIGWTDISVMSVNETAANSIRLWPSPATDVLHIELPATGNGETALVFDLHGKEVSRITVLNTITTIDCSRFASGSYTLSIPAMNMSRSFIVNH